MWCEVAWRLNRLEYLDVRPETKVTAELHQQGTTPAAKVFSTAPHLSKYHIEGDFISFPYAVAAYQPWGQLVDLKAYFERQQNYCFVLINCTALKTFEAVSFDSWDRSSTETAQGLD
jgi:hypothetical protein